MVVLNIEDGVIPAHHHLWEWEYSGDDYESDIIGIVCTYMWEIPPGPRGKKPRTRECRLYFDIDEVLAMIQKLGLMTLGSEWGKE